MGPNEPPKISDARKFLYYAGMAAFAIGLLTFLSTFLILFTGDPFRQGLFQSFGTRAVVGMLLVIGGQALLRAGARGLAGSGVILDPQRARREIEPWSRMAGGAIQDALSEVDAAKSLSREGSAAAVVKVRCKSCQALNDESSQFCGQCGARL